MLYSCRKYPGWYCISISRESKISVLNSCRCGYEIFMWVLITSPLWLCYCSLQIFDHCALQERTKLGTNRAYSTTKCFHGKQPNFAWNILCLLQYIYFRLCIGIAKITFWCAFDIQSAANKISFVLLYNRIKYSILHCLSVWCQHIKMGNEMFDFCFSYKRSKRTKLNNIRRSALSVWNATETHTYK